MNATELLADLSERGIRLVADGDWLRYHPRSALSAELLDELRQNKSDFLELLAAVATGHSSVLSDNPVDANEFYWHQTRDADRRYLLEPRRYPNPCMWCGGRLVHNPRCEELRLSWEPVVPYGRYAGQRLAEVPHSYLAWLGRQLSIDTKLRAAIQEKLRVTKRNGS